MAIHGLIPLLLTGTDGCYSPRGVPDGYMEDCSTSEDCTGAFECLPWTGPFPFEGDTADEGEPEYVCSLVCDDISDCPEITTWGHCDDLTVCANGVCGFRACY